MNNVLKKLQELKNGSTNYRLRYGKYRRQEMNALTRLASQVSGEKVTENDILEQFSTFHSAINHYYNVESTLSTRRKEFTEQYKYSLNFLRQLTNVNLSRVRKLEKSIVQNRLNATEILREKRKIVLDYLQNSGDFTRLIENRKDVFTTLDYAKTLKKYPNFAIIMLYNDIVKLGTTAIKSQKQLVGYYTATYMDKADKKSAQDIVKQRSGQTKEKFSWSELQQVNEDNYNFINEILDCKLKIVLRNGSTLIGSFRQFAKRTIRIGIFWKMVDRWRELSDYEIMGYNDYCAILRYMINTLGVYGFSAYLLQDKFVNNVLTIEVVD